MLVSLFWTHCNLYYKYLLIKTFSFAIYHERKMELVSQLMYIIFTRDRNTFSTTKFDTSYTVNDSTRSNFPCGCYYIGQINIFEIDRFKVSSSFHPRVIYTPYSLSNIIQSYIVSVIIEYFCYWLNYYWKKYRYVPPHHNWIAWNCYRGWKVLLHWLSYVSEFTHTRFGRVRVSADHSWPPNPIMIKTKTDISLFVITSVICYIVHPICLIVGRKSLYQNLK